MKKRTIQVLVGLFLILMVFCTVYYIWKKTRKTEPFQQKDKIAAVYNVWDGLELLPFSMRQMVPFADVVILVTQTIGNNGVHDEEPRIFCENLKKEFPSIHVEVHNPTDNSTNVSDNRVSKQIQKRNRGIEIAESMGCTVVVFVDTDEITATEDLRKAYTAYKQSGKNTAIALLKTYIRKPTYAVRGYDKTVNIALFQKIGQGQRIIGWSSNDSVKSQTVDMERTLDANDSYMVLDPNVCIVHHYSHVRKDYEKKVAAHASQQLKSIGLHEEAMHIEPGQKSKHYDEIIEEVPNKFNIVF